MNNEFHVAFIDPILVAISTSSQQVKVKSSQVPGSVLQSVKKMFYSNDLLVTKGGKFNVMWLLATSSNKDAVIR